MLSVTVFNDALDKKDAGVVKTVHEYNNILLLILYWLLVLMCYFIGIHVVSLNIFHYYYYSFLFM